MKWTLICALVGGVLGAMILCMLPADTHGPDYWKNIAAATPYFAVPGAILGGLVDLLRLVFRSSRASTAEKAGD